MSDSLAEAEKMMDRGWELLREHCPEEALEIGIALEGRRYSGGFEMQALALADLGRRPEAIEVLERGVETVPDVWLLWQLLGNYRSDEGDYEGAFAAYERASACECDRMSLDYNHGNALARAGRLEEARAKLEPLLAQVHDPETDPELARLIVGELGNVLRKQSKDAEADVLADRYAAVIGVLPPVRWRRRVPRALTSAWRRK